MTVPRALFRADASVEIGIGHLVRCRALADELVRRGWSVGFASRETTGAVAGVHPAEGYETLSIPQDVQMDDEPYWLAARLSSNRPLLIVDHYDVGAIWLERARAWAGSIVAVDDLANRPLPVDLLLNQNLGVDAAKYRSLVPGDARILTGPMYALLRPEFATIHDRRRARSGRVDRILVFLSGGDPTNVTGRAAEAADSVGATVDVVVGAGFPALAELRGWAAGRPSVEVHVQTPSMASLMERADLAVGAPGSAAWERSAVGLPSILVVLADNQREPGRQLARLGAAVMLGWHEVVDVETIRRSIEDVRAAPDRVRAMSDAAARITDGRGTERVMAEIEALVDRPTRTVTGV